MPSVRFTISRCIVGSTRSDYIYQTIAGAEEAGYISSDEAKQFRADLVERDLMDDLELS